MERPRGGGTHDTADQRGVERRWSGLAAGIAERDAGAVTVVVQKVVHVAANCACRQEASGKLGGLVLRPRLRQQAELDLPGHLQVVLQALLLLCYALVEPGVFNRDRDLSCKR